MSLDIRSARRGQHAQLAAAAPYRTRRRKETGQIDAIEPAHLREQIGAADELLRRRHAEQSADASELVAQRTEEAHEVGDGLLEFLRLEALEAALRGLDRGHDLRRDADVTRVELAAAADRAADRDHRERPESDAVRAEAHHLRDVERALHPAIAPELDLVAQARGDERAVRLGDADLRGQAGAAQRVLPRGAGAAVVAGERDDVGAGLRDPAGDDADVRHDGHLHRHARARVHRLQLVHDLREVLDRIDVVIVRRRDEVDPGLRVARERDLHRDLARREMPAFAGLRALADLDLEVVGRVREQRGDAEPARGDLLAAVARVL